jgi:long-subunit fatty acid transport protein
VSIFRDPAGLFSFDRPTFEMNVTAFAPSLNFVNAANPARVDGTSHTYPMFSMAYAGRRIGDDVAWAIGVEPIGGFGADFALQHELLSGPDGSAVDYETFFAALKAGPSVAWRFADGWSVGASFSLVYAQIRDFRMPFTMPANTPQGMGAIAQLDPQVYGPMFQQFTELTAYGDSDGYDGFGWSADLGLRYESDGGFAFAASWTPERPIDLDGGTAVIDMSAQFEQMMMGMVMARAQAYGESPEQAQAAVMQQLGAAGLDLTAGVTSTYDAATVLTIPMTAGAGVSLPLNDAVRFSSEVEWRRWSEAEATMPFDLTSGDNANINMMMNADPANASFLYPFPLEWNDTWTAKFGVEYTRPSGLAFRGGFIYGESPVPDNTVFIAFPAISRNAVTVGTSFAIGAVPLDVGYVHALATELDACNHGHLIGAEYLNSTSGMSQNVLTLGTRLSF